MRAKDKLVKALTEAGAPAEMVEDAKRGMFDDFESDYDTPIMALVEAATALGLTDIANRAKAGEFDGTKEDSDAWAAGPEGQAAFRELLGGK